MTGSFLLAGAEIGLVAAGMAIIGWQDPVLPATSVLPPVAYALVLIALGRCRACTSSSGGTRSN